MTILDHGLGTIVARLQAIHDPQARLMLFGAAVSELGGCIQFPAPGGNWGPHVVELSLLGITGDGDTAEEALENWTACARRHAESLAATARAEAIVNHPEPGIGIRELRDACDTVVQFSRDRSAITRAEMLLRATARAT